MTLGEKRTLMRRCQDNATLFEGLKLKPYKCPSGKLTIGIGRNIEDNGISEQEAFYLLNNDLYASCNDLKKNIFPNEWENLPDVIKEVLIDMRFNLGHPRFMQFDKMISAVRNYDWQSMIDEMRDSKWHTQVSRRAEHLICLIIDNLDFY